MMSAPLLVKQDGKERLWTVYQFAQLPSPGDRINITATNGRVQCLRVSHILHEPLAEGERLTPDSHTASVHAEWIEEFW